MNPNTTEASRPPRRKAPLYGIRILAISQFGAGPFATLNLADLGAEVIKIEDPRAGGDVARYVPPGAENGDSLYFQAFNRGKKSIAIDLRQAGGTAVFHRLVEKSDAVFNNLRGDLPGKLGLTYEKLKHLNPAIVTCSLSGFGRTGPRVSEPGYDAIMQGLAGYMSITGEPGAPPGKTGVSIIDFAGGYAAALGLVAALLEAKSTGVGRDVDVSLLDTAVSMLTYFASWKMNSDWQSSRSPGAAHQTLVPAQNFQTSDGWIVIFCAKEHFWRNLAELIGMPELATDERFVTFADRHRNRDILLPMLSERFQQRTSQEWLGLFRGKVPAGPVNTIEQALVDGQVVARGLVVDIEHPSYGTIRQVVSPITTEGSNRALTPGPALGADTDDVLAELLSLEPTEIDRLREQGAVG
ncbi:MAG: CoA transferase [Dehalococcoidia bacterium]|jgi:crotonobetainyl-CoA:carnitine CoA-transferase CaiB-like acyl-CoA transferase|nr:CoA transferase [Dehalococcoidia bacterium]